MLLLALGPGRVLGRARRHREPPTVRLANRARASRSRSSSTRRAAWAASSRAPSAASGRSRGASARAGRAPTCASRSSAYRDIGDAYVTRTYDFTGDMDEVFGHLSAFRAEGGGDGPEHVSAAMHDAVHRLTWSSGHALRMIVLVGDAPPHLDYQDGFDYRRHVGEARQKRDRGGVHPVRRGRADGAGLARDRVRGRRPIRAHRRPGRHAGAGDGGGRGAGAPQRGDRGHGGGRRHRRPSARTRRRSWPRAAPWRRPWPRKRRATSAPRDRIAAHDLVDLPVAEQKKALPVRAARR